MTAAGATIGKSTTYLDQGPACYAGFLVRFRPASAVDGGFIGYWMQSRAYWDQINLGAVRSTIDNFSAGKYRELGLSLPPLVEQQRIADFLDAQVSLLDRAIELRQQQATLIAEAGSARVRQAVLGLDQSGPRTQVSTPWIDSVPIDWTVEPLGRRFDVQLGKMLAPDRVVGERLRPYLRNTNVQWDRIDTHDLLVMNFPLSERARYEVRPGDLLVCEGGEVGRAAIWDGSVEEIYYQKALHRIRSRSTSCVRWVYYVLRVATQIGLFTMEAGTTIAHLTGEQLRGHRMPFPPASVEAGLVRALDAAADEEQVVAHLVGRQVSLLQERKQALITAAVTGQFDVSTASVRGVA